MIYNTLLSFKSFDFFKFYNEVAIALNDILRSDIPILPIQCPNCGSPYITQVLGTLKTVECLSCSSVFVLCGRKEIEKEGRVIECGKEFSS